ncbi:MAG: cytochrome d ubiquinol oxidase subunit II [Gammaproteobacteria bacterium RIFCSPHIGHO2_12_FULL_37_14]|nr:MAG: cytochrome d ubiquinol oxidase subunit II [Gammaproteobacteria bacterium RIFCSPHIGHO2_12_FULL_37_14]
MLDIETLRIIWWVLLGVLFIGFAVTDGFDLGAAILLPLVAKNETERRVVLNTIGPFWEGNQVWIILGAGAIFAAWPFVYAVAFSGFYFIMMLLLLTLGISRPVSFKYRSKLPHLFWRRFWDWGVFFGGIFPAVIFGILVGNILLGVSFHFDDTLRIYYTGSFTDLFQPFAWWCGLTSLMMLVMHGGLYLAIKTENPIRPRAIFWSRCAAVFLIICFAVGGLWVARLMGFAVIHADPLAYSNPLHKEVTTLLGGWLQNYSHYPFTIAAPTLGFIGALGAFITAHLGNSRFAFICSGLSIIGIISTVGVSMFPFILPSTTDLQSSLLVWDASSGQFTLLLMLAAVIVFLPIIFLYTSWVYYALRGKVSERNILEDKENRLY